MNVRRFLLPQTVALSALSLFGCSGSQGAARLVVVNGDVAPGTLLLDILEAGHPEHYWQYELQPTTGDVRVVKETTFYDYRREEMPRTFQEPAGAIRACAGSPNLTATSPDKASSARCRTAHFADTLEVDSAGAKAARIADRL